MKIAFDATVLHGQKSGVGYYCQELLKSMTSIDSETQFYVFSHQPLSQKILSGSRNVRFSESRFLSIRAIYLQALLPELLRREKPDLCHYTNFLAPIACNQPYVVTIHDMGLETLQHAHPWAKRLYTRRLVPRVAHRARLIITNSEYSKWEIVRYLGIPEDRIRVTPLAASKEFHPVDDTERLEVLDRHSITQPYFLYVGNLEPRKNLPRLLEAFSGLRDPDVQLAVVGHRWYRGGEAEEACRALGLSDRVRFLGYVPRTDLPALYSGSLALVYPSLLEGFGLPVVEAMACGAPVITSNNSSLKEIAEGAARLVDPASTGDIRDAMTDIAGNARYRRTLASNGLKQGRKYSWERTAELTLAAYRDAVDLPPLGRSDRSFEGRIPRPVILDDLNDAAQRTLDYCALFQYPLRGDELRERMFDVAIDRKTFNGVSRSLDIPQFGDFFSSNPEFVQIRAFREKLSDQAIQQVWPALKTLASLPFVRMIAFSGATAHRNMMSSEDIDLFLVIEHGKLWAAYLIAVIWAKCMGLRSRLCMNYLIADNALPLFEHDLFTAQQVASLKPIFGKVVYDRFIEANPFVWRHFPNFTPSKHRSAYAEIRSTGLKTFVEALLTPGPVQVMERIGRWAVSRYLKVKVERAVRDGACDVIMDSRQLKLHLNSHKGAILSHTASGALTPATTKR